MYSEAEKQKAVHLKEVNTLSNTTDLNNIRSDLSALFYQFAYSFKDYLSNL